jgi:hypothetical protein
MEQKRTNYIKLSLTNEEYEAVQLYSESINAPTSTAIRNLIELAVEVSSAFGELKNRIDELKNTEQGKPINDALNEFIEDMSFSDRVKLYSELNKLDAMAQFSRHWKTKNILSNIVASK